MTDIPKSFYWYDLETSGIKNSWDRITQFAGQRTDSELNYVGKPLKMYINPPDHVLLGPEATAVTGISPKTLAEQGISEWTAIQRIHEELIRPDTCTLGYNTISYDDHFIRFALFRNLFEPYAREYKNNNSRADMYPIVLAMAALRPQALTWPTRENGVRDFRLASVANANGIEAKDAHDAGADVQMTIELARLIKSSYPEFWDFAIRNRTKKDVKTLLDSSQSTFFIYVNRTYGAKRCCSAPVRVIAEHPEEANTIYVADLSADLSMLESATPQELATARFLSNEEVEKTGQTRLAIQPVRINQFPLFIPISNSLPDGMANRLLVDNDQVSKNIEMLHRIAGREFRARMHEMIALSERTYENSEEEDPAESLYSGSFPDRNDIRLCERLQAVLLKKDPWPNNLKFKDQRYARLASRLRQAEHPDKHPQLEAKYREYVKSCLLRNDVGLANKRAELSKMRKANQTETTMALLNELESQYDHVAKLYGV